MDLAVILAGAGDGRRMGSLGPKLLVPVGGRPALERVLEAFLEVESVGEIVAGIPESLMAQAKRAIASRPNPRGARLGGVTGGGTRAGTAAQGGPGRARGLSFLAARSRG